MCDNVFEMSMEGLASLKYSIVKKDNEHASFIARDIVSFCQNDILEIVSLKSSVKGAGRKMLCGFCELFKNHVIVLAAEPMYDSQENYEKALLSGDFNISLNKLREYYCSCGFIDINFYVNYENAIGFIYGNDVGREIVSKLSIN